MKARTGAGLLVAGAAVFALRAVLWAFGCDAAVAVVSGSVLPGWASAETAAMAGAATVVVHLAAVTVGPVLALAGAGLWLGERCAGRWRRGRTGVHPRAAALQPEEPDRP